MRYASGLSPKSLVKHKKKVLKRLSPFRYTKVVIIESLGQNDVSTGKILASYLSTLDSFVNQNIPLEILDCPTAQSLRAVLTKLTLEAETLGESPILHFECHGEATGNGLVLANGEMMAWTELAPILVNLNLLTKFNLMIFLAACNAFYFIEEMIASRPSPVYAVVAPSDELNPGEVMSGTRIYYRTLFEIGNAGSALQALKSENLSVGYWFGKTAEEWFEEVLVGYVKAQCSATTVAERARLLYQTQPSKMPRKSVGALKRGLHQEHKTFVQKYFEKCFQTESIPANLDRFDGLRKRVEVRVKHILTSRSFRH